MSLDPSMKGLSLDQAPPLSIPMSFFLAAPLALVAAGGLVVAGGAWALVPRWAPAAMGATHLGTLGFLAMVMFGALYQMLPVVAGARVPAVRGAHAVQAALLVGVILLVHALTSGRAWAFRGSVALLGLALLGFVLPAGAAMARTRAGGDTVNGMRMALASLAVVFGLGLGLALGHGEIPFVVSWTGWLYAHIGIGILGWVGGLITSVSWQVIPMFYLTAPFPRWSRLACLALSGASLAGVLACFALGPAALGVWVLHPVVSALVIARRKRRRVGESVRFWWAGLACAPLALASALAGLVSPEPRWPVLFGWLALAGWAGLIVHGMLTRIVPFLVWFHRYSPLVGLANVPSMRELLPDRQARVGLVLHVATVLVGALAIVFAWAPLVLAAGLGLSMTGIALFVAIVRVLRYRSPA